MTITHPWSQKALTYSTLLPIRHQILIVEVTPATVPDTHPRSTQRKELLLLSSLCHPPEKLSKTCCFRRINTGLLRSYKPGLCSHKANSSKDWDKRSARSLQPWDSLKFSIKWRSYSSQIWFQQTRNKHEARDPSQSEVRSTAGKRAPPKPKLQTVIRSSQQVMNLPSKGEESSQARASRSNCRWCTIMVHRIRGDCYRGKTIRGCRVMSDLTIQAPTTQHKCRNMKFEEAVTI